MLILFNFWIYFFVGCHFLHPFYIKLQNTQTTMTEHTTKRNFIQQKQAYHNAIISIPFFISSIPTKIIAFNILNSGYQEARISQKVYYNGCKFQKTNIATFDSLEESKCFYEKHKLIPKDGSTHCWMEYCKDLSLLENILYYDGKVYVPCLQNIQLRQCLSDLSQLVVLHGLFMEEHLRKSGNPLFVFLDHKILSLEYIYYRWRTFAYLQSDGDKKYRAEPFRMIERGSIWVPPSQGTLQRGILNIKQRKYFSELMFTFTRKKSDIEQSMVFAIAHMNCAIDIAIIIVLQIFGKIQEDYIKYFLLVSDILFNTTSQDYRRLFARIIPFIIHRINKISGSSPNKEQEGKLKNQLNCLINHWEAKFIFDQNYTRGLIFLLNLNQNRCRVTGIHDRLKKIGDIEDDEESEFQLEKLCFQNGLPYLEAQKQESTRLINEYLWLSTKSQQKVPQIDEKYDGQPLSDKDIAKLRNKQIKTITCEALGIGLLFDKSIQGKNRNNTSVSVDND